MALIYSYKMGHPHASLSTMITSLHEKIFTLLTLYMMTSSNGNIFRVTGPLCGEVTGYRWPVTPSLDVFFDLRLNNLFSKQSWG